MALEHFFTVLFHRSELSYGSNLILLYIYGLCNYTLLNGIQFATWPKTCDCHSHVLKDFYSRRSVHCRLTEPPLQVLPTYYINKSKPIVPFSLFAYCHLLNFVAHLIRLGSVPAISPKPSENTRYSVLTCSPSNVVEGEAYDVVSSCFA